jgi:hypothetical protein
MGGESPTTATLLIAEGFALRDFAIPLSCQANEPQAGGGGDEPMQEAAGCYQRGLDSWDELLRPRIDQKSRWEDRQQRWV